MVSKGSRRWSSFYHGWLYPHTLDVIYAATLLATTPYMVFTRRASHNYGHVIRRRGNVNLPPADRPRLWIHGVSVGEVLSARALVQLLLDHFPHWELVFSSTSRSGLAMMQTTYPGRPVFEFPFDFSWAVRRALRQVHPNLILIIEHELWPNFLNQAYLEKVPVVLVNAHVSDRSILGYRLLKKLIPWPPPAIVHLCAQNAETQERLARLGVPKDKVTVTGNLKYDNPCKEARDLREELGISSDSWVLVGASTHEGEEEILLDAFRNIHEENPDTRLIIIPRKIERAAELKQLIESRSFEVQMRSQMGREGVNSNRVILADTMGEIPAFCRTADVVFVGGSLVPFGGHNVIEPASLGRPVIVGPHSYNFRSIIQDFQNVQAITIAENAEGLYRALERFHENREEARIMGRRALQVVQQGRGASQRTFKVISRIIEGLPKITR